MLLISLTVREGRLSIDTDASLNTDQQPRRLKTPRGSALVCLGVEFDAPCGSPRASKPATVPLFQTGANILIPGESLTRF